MHPSIRLLVTLIAAITLSACAVQLQPVSIISQEKVHKYEKNYELNHKRNVYVGEPIIRVKDYYTVNKLHPAVEPSESFTVYSGDDLEMNFEKGKKYRILGTKMVTSSIKGKPVEKPYFIVSTDKLVSFLGEPLTPIVLVNMDGTLFCKGYINNTNGQMARRSLTEATARLIQVSEEVIEVTKGYQNHELLFSGIDKNSMSFTYREFTPDGLARVAYYQTVTYAAESKVIRFRNYKINVIETNSEGITYVVVED